MIHLAENEINNKTQSPQEISQKEILKKMADKQYEFSTRLADLVAQAQISGNKVHESDIKEFFEDLELADSQFDHIFAYLKASHITIEGYEAKEEIEAEVRE